MRGSPGRLGTSSERASLVYGDRIGAWSTSRISRPDSARRAASYRAFERMARSQAAALDEVRCRGRRPGGDRCRRAPARLLVSLFGVTGWGRILVPHRLFGSAPRRSPGIPIVEALGASCLLVDPGGLDGALAGVTAEAAPLRPGARRGDDALFGQETDPEPWDSAERDRHDQLPGRGPPRDRKAMRFTHRNVWIQHPVTFGWHLGVSSIETCISCCTMSFTAAAGACRMRSRGWAPVRSCYARSTAPRSLRPDRTSRCHAVEQVRPTVCGAVLGAAQRMADGNLGRGQVRVTVAKRRRHRRDHRAG